MTTTSFLTGGHGIAALAGTVLLLLAAPASGDAPYDPFKVPKQQVLDRVFKIALTTARFPTFIEEEGNLRTSLELLVISTLEGNGFAVIPSEEHTRTWQRLSEHTGGAFDPSTGSADPAKLEAIRELTARELATQQQSDAVLSIAVTEGAMRFWGTPLLGFEAPGGPLTWQGATLFELPQRVNGTHLNFLLHDNAGVLMYSIQVPIEWTEVYVARSHDRRLDAHLFQGPVVGMAVRTALERLSRHSSATPTRPPPAAPWDRRRRSLPPPPAS